MSHLDNLIRLRIYNVIESINKTLGDYLSSSPYSSVDIELWVSLKKFFFDFSLKNAGKFILAEEYDLRNYHFEIVRYHYALLDKHDQPQVSYDNAPHHPSLVTFPHHKHFYPKSKHFPVGFSGDLRDALEEIKWMMEFK